jgi:hypothetical protein
MMNRRVLVNLHVDDLNLVLMDAMKVYLNQAVPDDHLEIHQMMGDQMMGDRNYSVYLNFRDARPCTHSLITIEI